MGTLRNNYPPVVCVFLSVLFSASLLFVGFLLSLLYLSTFVGAGGKLGFSCGERWSVVALDGLESSGLMPDLLTLGGETRWVGRASLFVPGKQTLLVGRSTGWHSAEKLFW